MNHSIEISRKELYEEVWSEAMSKVARRYGLSDVGLAKICSELIQQLKERCEEKI